MFFKGSDYGQEVTDAIATLDTKVAAFKEGIDICSAERLGQVHQITTATYLDTKQGFTGEASQLATIDPINSHAFRNAFR